MKRFALSLLMIFSVVICGKGQVNLVTNPSFEILIGCPTSGSQIDSVAGWNTPMNGGGGNPDDFNVCCTIPSICGVPTNTFNLSSQYAHSGNGYVGIDALHSSEAYDFREYIQSKLVKKLKSGNNYCVTFYASLSDQSTAYIRPLGAYMDDGSVSAPTMFGLAVALPQVYNTTLTLDDIVNWMKIEGSFVATGNEEYITIGNFFSDSLSEVGVIGTPISLDTYYYIDDVSLIDADLSAHAGNDTLIAAGDSVFIGRPSEVGLDEDCIWFVGGVAIDTVAGLWVKPDSSTTYVVQQSICGNVKYDTLHVTVSGVGLEKYSGNSKGLIISPNPATTTLSIQTPQTSSIEIFNLEGQILKTLPNAPPTTTIDVSGLPSGIYFIKATSEKQSLVRKFVKE